MSRVHEGTVRIHAGVILAATGTRDWLADRVQWHDDRGDITPRIIGIATMAALALAVLAIVTARVTAKANTISLD